MVDKVVRSARLNKSGKKLPTFKYSNLTLGAEKSSYNPKPLVDEPACFDEELMQWVKNRENIKTIDFANTYFSRVLSPMHFSWLSWKEKNIDKAVQHAEDIEDLAWREACVQWLVRRA